MVGVINKHHLCPSPFEKLCLSLHTSLSIHTFNIYPVTLLFEFSILAFSLFSFPHVLYDYPVPGILSVQVDIATSVVTEVAEELGGDPKLTAAKLLFLQEQVSSVLRSSCNKHS